MLHLNLKSIQLNCFDPYALSSGTNLGVNFVYQCKNCISPIMVEPRQNGDLNLVETLQNEDLNLVETEQNGDLNLVETLQNEVLNLVGI